MYLDLKQMAAAFLWKLQGQPVPQPHSVKAYFLKKVLLKSGIRILVETGTHKGDMVAAMRPFCNEIYSIELDETLFKEAKKRFKGDENIYLYQGDSSHVLGDVLKALDAPAVFWLDGHYSAGNTAKGALDTPIVKEIEHIAQHKHAGEHVLLIDDARCFDGTNDYPTREELQTILSEKGFSEFKKVNDTFVTCAQALF